jgi:hypothetical protein
MLDVNSALREIALRTSRRTILAKTGRALIGGALLTLVRAESAEAVTCAACDSTLYCEGTAACSGIAGTRSSCCVGPDTIYPACNPRTDLGGSWCGGSADAWGGTCVTGWTTGWVWYCCSFDRELQAYRFAKCQDCCQGPSTVCTTRQTLGSCTP